MASTFPRGLYGMVDLQSPPTVDDLLKGPSLARTSGPRLLAAAGKLAVDLHAGGAQVLQVRMKGGSAAAMLTVLGELRGLLPDVKILVNDRLDVALAGRADGVHLGQTDVPLWKARAICPPGFVIGISTHNEAQAQDAALGGADYIALGPIYPTRSKADPDPIVGIERLAALCQRLPIPVVAIGGITLDRIQEVVAAGAAAAAIIAAVNDAPDVTQAARKVTQAFGGQTGA